MPRLKSIEQTGKTYDEALTAALAALGAERDEVDVATLDPGSKGIFGIGGRLCRILVTRLNDPVRTAKTFLREVSAAMGTAAEVSAELSGSHLAVELVGGEMGVFIGKRGQTLDSLQYLLSLVVNKDKGEKQYISVTLDAENYRGRRKETLESLARNLAKKAIKTRKSVVLEPMTPNERRIIHSALQNDKFVATHSEGEDPYRNVVITLKKPDIPPPRKKPAPAAADPKPKSERSVPSTTVDKSGMVTIHKPRPKSDPVPATESAAAETPDTAAPRRRNNRRRPKSYTGYQKPLPSWKRYAKDGEGDTSVPGQMEPIEFED